MILESPLESKEIKPVNPKGNQPWIFIARTDAEAPILWPPDANSQLIRKDPNAGKDWGQKEKGATEDEMVRWHHQLNGHEFEQTPWDNAGQGSLACCSPRSHEELYVTEWLINNKSIFITCFINCFLKSIICHKDLLTSINIAEYDSFLTVALEYVGVIYFSHPLVVVLSCFHFFCYDK